jgi:hypothetical protein
VIARRWQRDPERLAERGWALSRALLVGLVVLGASGLLLAAADALEMDAPSSRMALAIALVCALATFALAPWRARATRREPAS